MIRAGVAALILALAHAAAPPAAGVERNALYSISRHLVGWYNTGDADAIRAALSPDLARKYDQEAIERVIVDCKRRHGDEIARLSLPTSGTRNYAFFAVYIRSAVLDMILEIDESRRIVFWTMSPNAMDDDLGCSFHSLR